MGLQDGPDCRCYFCMTCVDHVAPLFGCSCARCRVAREQSRGSVSVIPPRPQPAIGSAGVDQVELPRAPVLSRMLLLAQCGNCRWLSRAFGSAECHRHAPVPNARAASGDMRTRIFPIVNIDDRCGDFERATP